MIIIRESKIFIWIYNEKISKEIDMSQKSVFGENQYFCTERMVGRRENEEKVDLEYLEGLREIE